MKICCLSDLHGQLPKILPSDILLIAGDICPHFARPVGGSEDMFCQAHWLTHTFNSWLESLQINRAVAIWGTPWQPYFHDWAFNAPPDCGDIAPDGRPTGSNALLQNIIRVKPKLTVHGHIHCGYGKYQIGPTTVINAAILDEEYKMTKEPIYVEI